MVPLTTICANVFPLRYIARSLSSLTRPRQNGFSYASMHPAVDFPRQRWVFPRANLLKTFRSHRLRNRSNPVVFFFGWPALAHFVPPPSPSFFSYFEALPDLSLWTFKTLCKKSWLPQRSALKRAVYSRHSAAKNLIVALHFVQTIAQLPRGPPSPSPLHGTWRPGNDPLAGALVIPFFLRYRTSFDESCSFSFFPSADPSGSRVRLLSQFRRPRTSRATFNASTFFFSFAFRNRLHAPLRTGGKPGCGLLF